jgi:hypothetical protein
VVEAGRVVVLVPSPPRVLVSAPVRLDDVLAQLRRMSEEARARLKAGAEAGDAKARQLLRELDGTAGEVQVDPRPPPPHWQERAECEPGEDDVT